MTNWPNPYRHICLDNWHAGEVAEYFDISLEEGREALEKARTMGAASFSWPAVADAFAAAKAAGEIVQDYDGAGCFVYIWLGSLLALSPSGKIYAPWTSNQTATDIAADALWAESLEAGAQCLGGWIGAPDGCAGDDVFICIDADDVEAAKGKSAALADYIASHL